MEEMNTIQSLELVMSTLRKRSPSLAETIQRIIDEGTLVAERSQLKVENPTTKRRSEEYVYERRVPLSDERALATAIDVLQAHLVELPLCISSAYTELSLCEIAATANNEPPMPLFSGESSSKDVSGQEITKASTILIDRAHEGMILREDPIQPLELKLLSATQLKEQKSNLDALANLLRE